MTESCPDGEALGRAALEWLLRLAREDGTALAWTGRPDDDELDPMLYSGAAGIVLAFLEGYQHFEDERFAVAAVRGACAIAAAVDQEWELSSYARIRDGRDPGYAITWPDHLAAAS